MEVQVLSPPLSPWVLALFSGLKQKYDETEKTSNA